MSQHDRRHEKLTLMCLTAEQRALTCDYWYTITTFGSTPHTAMRTRAALEFWLQTRGLHLTRPLPDTLGTHTVIPLEGQYRERFHSRMEDLPQTGRKILVMSNGAYTEGRVTQEEGCAVIHAVHANAPRRVIPHDVARRHEDAGHASDLPIWG